MLKWIISIGAYAVSANFIYFIYVSKKIHYTLIIEMNVYTCYNNGIKVKTDIVDEKS